MKPCIGIINKNQLQVDSTVLNTVICTLLSLPYYNAYNGLRVSSSGGGGGGGGGVRGEQSH